MTIHRIETKADREPLPRTGRCMSDCLHDHGAQMTGDMPAGQARCLLCGQMLPMYVPLNALADRLARLADKLEHQAEKDDWR